MCVLVPEKMAKKKILKNRKPRIVDRRKIERMIAENAINARTGHIISIKNRNGNISFPNRPYSFLNAIS